MRSFQFGINVFSISLFILIFTTTGFAADPSLVAHWQLDGDATDSSGNGHDGTVYGNPIWVAESVDGGAVQLDGQGDFISAPAHSDLQPEFPFSVCLWMKAKNPASNSFIVSSGPPDDDTYISGFRIQFIGDFSGRIKATYKNGGPSHPSSRHGKDGSTILQADTWYHVAAVVRGYRDIDLYVNGVSEGDYDIGTATSIAYSNENFFIGSYNESRLFFDGAIDDVRIYNRALSSDEVMQLYDFSETLTVHLDIKPGSCPNRVNVRSKGVLPVAILGSEEFDVNTIDPASIRVNDVGPIRSHLEDVAAPLMYPNECECTKNGPDGYPDLALKFDTQQIVETLGEVNRGDTLTLLLTGVLNDETPIEGADCVMILGWHKPLNKCDLNKDGVVNAVDMAIFAENWLESSLVDN